MSIGAVLANLSAECRARAIDFILIGGWALKAHGVTRQTLAVSS